MTEGIHIGSDVAVKLIATVVVLVKYWSKEYNNIGQVVAVGSRSCSSIAVDIGQVAVIDTGL